MEPKDYEDMADDMERRLRGDAGTGNVFNGSTKYVNAMLALIVGLLVAVICGGVQLYGQVQRIDGKVELIITGHIK